MWTHRVWGAEHLLNCFDIHTAGSSAWVQIFLMKKETNATLLCLCDEAVHIIQSMVIRSLMIEQGSHILCLIPLWTTPRGKCQWWYLIQSGNKPAPPVWRPFGKFHIILRSLIISQCTVRNAAWKSMKWMWRCESHSKHCSIGHS